MAGGETRPARLDGTGGRFDTGRVAALRPGLN